MIAGGGRKVDHEVRSQEVVRSLSDKVAYNVCYFGRTEILYALDTDPVWQIWRVQSVAGIGVTLWADDAKYRSKWSDRATLFPAEPAYETDPGILVNLNQSLLKPVKNPKNFTVTTSVVPDTETSFTMTTIKRFKVINRGAVTVKYSYLAGDSGTNFVSIPPSSSSEEVNIDDQTVTLYLQAPSPSQRLEFVTWG